MTSTEVKAKRRVRTNFKTKLDDLVLYCKIQIEVLESTSPTLNEPGALGHKIAAFKTVLKRLGVEP